MLAAFGRFVLFLGEMVVRPERPAVLWRRTLEEAVLIGVDSVLVVSVVALFIGAVTCVQVCYNFNFPLIPRTVIGYMVREMVVLELAPTIISVVLAGKVGSSIAGSLGTMRLTEQIDALEVMSLNTRSYLVLPRVAGAMLMFPLLVVLAMVLGLLGGYLAGTGAGLLTAHDYVAGLRFGFVPFNVWFALLKAVVFGFLVAAIAAYCGFHARGGALAVGAGSTAAVTRSVVAILVADFVLARLLL